MTSATGSNLIIFYFGSNWRWEVSIALATVEVEGSNLDQIFRKGETIA